MRIKKTCIIYGAQGSPFEGEDLAALPFAMLSRPVPASSSTVTIQTDGVLG